MNCHVELTVAEIETLYEEFVTTGLERDTVICVDIGNFSVECTEEDVTYTHRAVAYVKDDQEGHMVVPLGDPL
ncbi:MAG: hypothetical protein ACRDCE_05615 [Cetobacterium sp.]|uniref:hypothetical protein n=1 Tax=Cetobacterium sp. TaxID=2071632 RepID=UPI003EE80129